jgi:hypothetical protein
MTEHMMATMNRPGHGAQGMREGAFWHNCTGITRHGGGGWSGASRAAPHAHRLGLVCLPHFVEQLHHLIINDKHNGHIQADPAQAGDSAFVESEWRRGTR